MDASNHENRRDLDRLAHRVFSVPGDPPYQPQPQTEPRPQTRTQDRDRTPLWYWPIALVFGALVYWGVTATIQEGRALRQADQATATPAEPAPVSHGVRVYAARQVLDRYVRDLHDWGPAEAFASGRFADDAVSARLRGLHWVQGQVRGRNAFNAEVVQSFTLYLDADSDYPAHWDVEYLLVGDHTLVNRLPESAP